MPDSSLDIAPHRTMVLTINGAGWRDAELTAREREVAKRLAEDATVKAIALELGLSPKTVEFHSLKLRRRLGVGIAGLARWAERTGLVSACLLLAVNASGQSFFKSLLPPAPTNVVKGETIKLGWDLPAEKYDGIRIYASSNKLQWREVAKVGWTNQCVVSNVFLPQWFVARSFTTNAESIDSNRLGILGYETIVRVWSKQSYSLAGPWTNAVKVFDATNAPGQMYFAHTAERTTRRVIE